MLSNEGRRRLDEILSVLSTNPNKTNWPPIYKYETLKYQKYRGLTIHSLRLSNRDRFCYSVDEKEQIIYVYVLAMKNHYTLMSHHFVPSLNAIRSLCETKEQKRAFNNLLRTFKFDNIK